MKFTISKEDIFTIVYVNSNIEFYSSLDLKQAVEKLSLREGEILIFDMSKVVSIDSFGFGLLVTENQKAKSIGYEVRFVGVSDRLKQRMMEIILIGTNQFYTTLDEAKRN